MPRREKKRKRAGAPAWMSTFADLSTLLLVFFVLLLSFSEVDVHRYRQLVGSMKAGFGVQRPIEAQQAPMATSFVVQEFSPGDPQPTPLESVQPQMARQLNQIRSGEQAERPPERPRPVETAGHPRAAESPDEARAPTGVRADTARIQRLLREEIQRGLVEVQREGRVITLRIRERGSFPSGRAELIEPFDPVLDKIVRALESTEGSIVFAGHTDDVPIRTARFRSNWELSVARAVTVAHRVLARSTTLEPRRVTVRGHADTLPLAANASAADRARNRRVEIQIRRGASMESAVEAEALLD